MMTEEESQHIAELDGRHLWHPFTQEREWHAAPPLVIERASGNYLIDTAGRRYLDGVSSLWVTVHGHRKKEIDDAIRAQLRKVAHSTLLGLSNVPAATLAARLADITPPGLTRVFYSDSGSTAVEIALKVAFQYWQQVASEKKKHKFIAFTGAYHGDTIGAMSVGEIGTFVKKFRPLLFRALRAPYPYCYRCPLKKTPGDCSLACLGELEKILEEHADSTAACIIEPLVQGAAGMITAPPGFLRGVRRLTKKYDVLLICDEVATGFGRTGKMFASEHEKVRPDIICLAKGITGGYLPLAATLFTEKIYNAFLGAPEEGRAFYHGHTYTGNPLACAAALASLDIFEKERVVEGVVKKAALLRRLLRGFKDMAHVGDIRQRGLMAGIELVMSKKTKRRFPAFRRMGHRVCMEARNHGLVIRPLGDTIVLMPPLSIKEEELRKMTEVIRTCMERVVS
jgi:adenosylmethionine-8-amino-7-oxononanoate aminotransferase